MHYVNQIIALREHFVNFLTAKIKLDLQGISNAVLNYLRMWLIADAENILLGYYIVKARSSCLQVVQCVAHISLSREYERLYAALLGL